MKAALHGDARRPPETLSAFGKELRRFLERDDVMAILEDGDWGAGGCWILAEALARWLGPPAEIVAVGYPGIPVDHVAVKYADTYIDYRGAQSEREFMGNAATDRPGLIPKIRPFTKRLRRQAREWSIPCEPWQAGRLLSKLHQAFPETGGGEVLLGFLSLGSLVGNLVQGAQNADLKAAARELRDHYDVLARRYKQAAEAYSLLREENRRLWHQSEHLRGLLDQAHRGHNELLQASAALRKAVADLRSENAKLKGELENLAKEKSS